MTRSHIASGNLGTVGCGDKFEQWMAFSGEGARQKDKSLNHAKMLLGHSFNARAAAQIFKGDVIGWDHLLTE
jgi:hypothetical protein